VAKPVSRVQLLAESNGQYIPIDNWLSWAEDQIARHSAEIDHLKRQSAEVNAQLAIVRSELQATVALAKGPAETAELKHRMRELDQRLNKILALVNDRLGGGQNEQGMLHHSHAQEYVSLVEQHVMSLMRQVLQGEDATPMEKAGFVALVCAALFDSPQVRQEDLIRNLGPNAPASTVDHARDICTRARALRGKVADGRRQRWRFDFTYGVGLDAAWQEPWAGSFPDGLVDFVVCPAYVVDSDTLLVKQRVFTIMPHPDKAMSPQGRATHPDAPAVPASTDGPDEVD